MGENPKSNRISTRRKAGWPKMKKTQMVKKGNTVIDKEENREIRKNRTKSEEKSQMEKERKLGKWGDELTQ